MLGGKAHYDYDYWLWFFIVCDIWSTVENYFQKILSPHPWKIPLPPFYSLHLLKIKSARNLKFARTENCSWHPSKKKKGGGGGYCGVPVCPLCICVCNIKSKYKQKPCDTCQSFSKFNALSHKTHNKVLLVLKYQGLTRLGP